MRRGKIVSILTVILALVGVGFIAPELRRLIVDVNTRYAIIAGIVFLLLAATAGCLALTLFRKESRRLSRIVNLLASGARPELADAEGSDLQALVRSINELIEFADHSVTDATIKTKELEIQLKVATARRQHAEAILHSISDAVLVTDTFDELLLANEAAARTFDFDLSQAGRTPIDQMLRDKAFVAMIRDMRQSDSTNGSRVVEHKMLTSKGPDGAPGEARIFKVTLSCVTDQSDEPAGVVTVLHDMTREKEVAQMKNDFVSNVSHELRTPLASIKAYVEMLIDGEADDEKTTREFYEVIQSEANRLGRLIDNILNISRIESGLIKINKKPLSLAVVLKDATEVIEPQARMKQIIIKSDATPIFYQTLADRDMLYQAVLNLLSNSVKYTPDGGQITITTAIDEQTKKAITRISDTGVGIPPKDLPFVFDKFYRSEANNKVAKGTGLGLSLVKHIVETVHGGRVFVESTVGKGSTFGIEMDLA